MHKSRRNTVVHVNSSHTEFSMKLERNLRKYGMRGLGGGKGGGWMGDFLPTFPELMDGAQRYKLDFGAE